MNGNEDRMDALLDETLERLRASEADDATVASAADRVRARLLDAIDAQERERHDAAQIRSCEDWQKLIPSLLDGSLSDARRLLLQDHTRECVPCRRALREARSATATAPRAAARRSPVRPGWRRDWTWVAAAAVLAGIALLGFGIRFGGLQVASGGLVRVETVNGSLMQVADLLTTPAVAGEEYGGNEALRTARDSGAVMKLADGSRIEMNERSELSVRASGADETIVLERGDILVQAAHRDAGKLFVQTPDFRVEVTGTVFAVTAGTKGSRVSVLEGEVVVDDDSRRHVLMPGQQFASGSRMLPVPVADDVAWSRDAEHWLAVAHEVDEFQRELDRRVGDVNRRFVGSLLSRVPAGTVVYVAIPNLAEVVTEAHSLMLERVAESDTFRSWWDSEVVASGADRKIDEAIAIVGRLGKALGDEIVVTLQSSGSGDVAGPVVLAKVRDAAGARAEIDALLAGIAESGDAAPVRRVDSPADAGGSDGAWIWVGDDVLALATDGGALARAAGGDATGFEGSEFGRRLASAYRHGVGVLVGADLQTMIAQHGMAAGDDRAFDVIGLRNVRHLLVERSDLGDINVTRATLTVEGEREGVLSWLAAPAPMGSLEFVSPDALAVSAFVVRQPATLLEDLLTRLGDDGREVRDGLDRFREEHGIDLIHDIAGMLGGEVAFALDGPVLPKPAWKAIVEVYDPAALQRTLEWAVAQIASATDGEAGGVRLVPTERRGRTYWAIESDKLGVVAHYAFVDGYWILASQDAMIDRALQFRSSGVTLGASKKFLTSLPQDGHDNVSAVLYQDLGRIIGSVLDGPIGKSLPPERIEAIRAFGSHEGPTTFVAYGERDRIEVVGTDRGSFLFGNQLSRLFDVRSLLDLGDAVHDVAPDDPAPGYDGAGRPGGEPDSTS